MTNTIQNNVKENFPIAPIFWGFLAFFVNWYSYQYFNTPAAEILLFLITVQVCLRRGVFLDMAMLPGFGAFVILMVWIIVADAVNEASGKAFVRETVRNIVLFCPIFFFALVPNRRYMPAFCLGLLFGLGLFFNLNVFYYLITEHDIPLELKWMLPTPSVFLSAYLLTRKNIPLFCRQMLLVGLVTSTVFGLAVDGRGAILSLFLLGGFAFAATYIPRPAIVIPCLIVGMLMTHFLLMLVVSDMYGLAIAVNSDSWSNLERAALIDFTQYQIGESPLFGMGQGAFVQEFDGYFRVLSHFRALGNARGLQDFDSFFHERLNVIESPHNSFLEYSVFYGVPGGLCLLAIFFRVSRFSLLRTGHPAIVAGALSMIVRHGALYGFNNIYRLEWFATMFFILWYVDHEQAVREAGSTTG